MNFVGGMLLGQAMSQSNSEETQEHPIGLPYFIELTLENGCRRLIDIRLVHQIIEEPYSTKDTQTKKRITKNRVRIVLAHGWNDLFPRETYEEIKEILGG